MLFYPLQYEGLEESKYIIYTGAAPNQQIIPAVTWAVKTFGARVYLIGSDYIFPHVANWLIKKQLTLLQATTVQERYVAFGSHDFQHVAREIQQLKPDIILNTINGDANADFFHALKQAGIQAEKLPVLSFSLAEAGIKTIPIEDIQGHYAAWNYFQSLSNPRNRAFVRAFQKRYGKARPITDPMEAAWIGIHLWAKAVRSSNSSNPLVIHHAILQQSLNAPEGIVTVDPNNRHLWKTPRIGKVNAHHQFDIVWSLDHAIRPYPYPIFINKAEYRKLLETLYMQWGEHWSAYQPTAMATH